MRALSGAYYTVFYSLIIGWRPLSGLIKWLPHSSIKAVKVSYNHQFFSFELQYLALLSLYSVFIVAIRLGLDSISDLHVPM